MKIIADPDGEHITVLVLKVLMLLYPRLVEAGMIYSAVPPLYGVPSKNNKEKIERYFTTRADYTNWLYSNFNKSNNIEKVDGNKLSTIEAKDILYKNVDYVYDMDVFSNRYAIDVTLLEQVVFNIITAEKEKKDLYKFMKKSIESDKRYRFLKVSKEMDTVTIKGEFNDLIQTIILSKQFMNDLKILLQHVDDNPIWYFKLNGNVCSLHGFISAFEKSAPAHIIRYKGLGEMDEKQLQVTTLHPDMDRTLLRFNLQSANEVVVKMRALESNKIKLLEGRRNTREDLIG